MKFSSTVFLTFTILLFSFYGMAQNRNDVSGQILHTSGKVNINGNNFFYSEVKIINQSKIPIQITSAIVTTQNGKTLYKVTNEELKKLSNKNRIDSSVDDSTIFYFDVPFEKLQHQEKLKFVFNYILNLDKELQLILETNFLAKEPVVLSAPLRGKNWIAIYNSEWQRGHRRVYYTVDGKPKIPGRFAIDFVKLDNEGKLFQQNSEIVTDYYSYNEDVLAVADGIVVSLRNDFKESETIAGNTIHTENEASGNYIAIEIGKDLYAFYEHLKPGCILVNVGDKVKSGEVIAKVGFTGDASEPHLHFHIADKNSVLGAEGLPFLFKEFSYEGVFDDFGNFGKLRWNSFKKAEIKNILPSRPLPNSVINFPN